MSPFQLGKELALQKFSIGYGADPWSEPGPENKEIGKLVFWLHPRTTRDEETFQSRVTKFDGLVPGCHHLTEAVRERVLRSVAKIDDFEIGGVAVRELTEEVYLGLPAWIGQRLAIRVVGGDMSNPNGDGPTAEKIEGESAGPHVP